MRTTPRPRRRLHPAALRLLSPILRYSTTRDAYVLRGVGNHHWRCSVLTQPVRVRLSRTRVAARERMSMTRRPATVTVAVRAARRRAERARGAVSDRDPLWPAQAAVLAAILLSATLPDALTIGGRWLMPGLEGALFVIHIATTPRRWANERLWHRYLRLSMVGLVSAANVISLFVIAGNLVGGGQTNARHLLVGGAVLWVISVLLFAVWFWELDRGGPKRRLDRDDDAPDFLFPQMSDRDWVGEDWEPAFDDYLFLSLHNAASYAPPETVPLTRSARLLVSLQTLASLAVTLITLSYAVNNLS
jgi:hypothetical protein